jgi:hypothetical protein
MAQIVGLGPFLGLWNLAPVPSRFVSDRMLRPVNDSGARKLLDGNDLAHEPECSLSVRGLQAGFCNLNRV